MTLVYLGQPYAHPNARVRHLRYKIACAISSELNRRGRPNFSPIAHSHNIEHAPPKGWVEDLDLPILRICSTLLMVDIIGWTRSRGLAAEREFAIANNIPIELLFLEGYPVGDLLAEHNGLISAHGIVPE